MVIIEEFISPVLIVNRALQQKVTLNSIFNVRQLQRTWICYRFNLQIHKRCDGSDAHFAKLSNPQTRHRRIERLITCSHRFRIREQRPYKKSIRHNSRTSNRYTCGKQQSILMQVLFMHACMFRITSYQARKFRCF